MTDEDRDFFLKFSEIDGRQHRSTSFSIRDVKDHEVSVQDKRRYAFGVAAMEGNTTNIQFVTEADIRALNLLTTRFLQGSEMPDEI